MLLKTKTNVFIKCFTSESLSYHPGYQKSLYTKVKQFNQPFYDYLTVYIGQTFLKGENWTYMPAQQPMDTSSSFCLVLSSLFFSDSSCW